VGIIIDHSNTRQFGIGVSHIDHFKPVTIFGTLPLTGMDDFSLNVDIKSP